MSFKIQNIALHLKWGSDFSCSEDFWEEPTFFSDEFKQHSIQLHPTQNFIQFSVEPLKSMKERIENASELITGMEAISARFNNQTHGFLSLVISAVWKNCAQEEKSSLKFRKQTEHTVLKYLEFFKNHFNKDDKILEIGAGHLDVNGTTHLFNLFTKAFDVSDWTFSDTNEMASSQKNKKYIAFPLTKELNPKLKDAYNCIVGCNVLDTLPENDLQIALKNIHQCLKKGGIFFHITDQQPHHLPFYAAHLKPTVNLFPYKNGSSFGVCSIEKKAYAEELKKQSENIGEAYFLFEMWDKFSPNQQIIGLNNLEIDYNFFSSLIQTIFRNVAKTTFLIDWFHEHLKKNLDKHLWKIIRHPETVTASLTVKNSSIREYNHVVCNYGSMYAKNDNISQNHIKQTCKFGLMVAQKI